MPTGIPRETAENDCGHVQRHGYVGSVVRREDGGVVRGVGRLFAIDPLEGPAEAFRVVENPETSGFGRPLRFQKHLVQKAFPTVLHQDGRPGFLQSFPVSLDDRDRQD